MTLQPNQIITHKDGTTRKVLEVLTQTALLTDYGNNEKAGICWYTEKELRDMGYTWDVPKWKPRKGEEYFYIDSEGMVDCDDWDGGLFGYGRLDFLGVYPTREAAEAALVEIKKKLA